MRIVNFEKNKIDSAAIYLFTIVLFQEMWEQPIWKTFATNFSTSTVYRTEDPGNEWIRSGENPCFFFIEKFSEMGWFSVVGRFWMVLVCRLPDESKLAPIIFPMMYNPINLNSIPHGIMIETINSGVKNVSGVTANGNIDRTSKIHARFPSISGAASFSFATSLYTETFREE